MNNNSYSCISNFGSGTTAQSNPMATCMVTSLDSGFNVGSIGSRGIAGPASTNCQIFTGTYCGQNWDGACEYLSQDTSQFYPNMIGSCNGISGSCSSGGLGANLTRGQQLIRNACAERFLVAMSSNCKRDYMPFDPTVANSPLISTWSPGTSTCNNSGSCEASNKCVPVYGVDPATIDSDVVMNKVLAEPWIALDILVNMYNNAVTSGEIKKLTHTKLYKLFTNRAFQNIVRSGLYKV